MRLFSLSKVFTGHESGVSLLETVVALAILGTIVVTFLSGVATTSKAAFTTDERATAESLARSQMESVQSANFTAQYSPESIPDGKDYVNYSANITTESLGDGLQKITVTVNRSGEQVFILEGYKREIDEAR